MIKFLIGRFKIDVNTFENANSKITLIDTITNLSYQQLYCDHIKGSLPKEISYSNVSRKELSLVNIIRDMYPDKEIILGYRPKWLNRKELDIYIPELNIAIEYNGIVYHHSSTDPTNQYLIKTRKDEEYHTDKFNTCLENGVKLIHIFEQDLDHLDIKSVIQMYLSYNVCCLNTIHEYVNTRTLLYCDKNVPHTVLVCRPNIMFFS